MTLRSFLAHGAGTSIPASGNGPLLNNDFNYLLSLTYTGISCSCSFIMVAISLFVPPT